MLIAYAGNSRTLADSFLEVHGEQPSVISLEELWNETNSLKNTSKDVTIVWTLTEPNIDRDFIDKFPNLDCVVTSTTGLTHIDTHLLNSRGIRIRSLKDVAIELDKVSSSAEHAWLLIMTVWRRLKLFARDPDFWNISKARYKYRFDQLQGKKIGIIGMGRIGRKVAEYAKAFRMQVAFYDPYIGSSQFEIGTRHEILDQLLVESDIILISASKLTSDLILNRNSLTKLRPESVLINVSRGSLVDEQEVIRMIRSGRLSGLGLDVFGFEELGLNSVSASEWQNLDSEGFNVVLTPHIAGAASDAAQTVREMLISRLFSFGPEGWVLH